MTTTTLNVRSGTAVMVGRELRRTVRSIDGLVLSIVLPAMILLSFVVIFGGAMNTGTEYVDYVVPAVIVLCAGYGAANTAVSVATDMTTGTIGRFRTLPTYGSAVLVGHVITSVLRNLASSAVVVGVSFALGFRPSGNVAGWLTAVGILLVFVVAMTWIACLLGLLLSPEAASGSTFLMIFLPYISSGFVPVNTLPEWIRGIAEHQPLTPVIEAVRSNLMGNTAYDDVWLALAWWIPLGVAAHAGAAVLFQRTRKR
ncbi:ABC-2 type transport system permease protein [Arthrobacter pigmenti]|uniref:Transport permease protein n=1 Tax=Arthrobacter pigmenti TaxID=271432 RepID=A0A846RH13_9MICC|nr:ABC transporter permease [Arthrobacter pigmenti]NJC20980.1 ABC-2 type transport system permease protein [Arthrobacter pigmenti]